MACQDLPSVRAKLEAAGQSHVLQYVDEGKCTEEEIATLCAQVAPLDLPQLRRIFEDVMSSLPATGAVAAPVTFEPISEMASTKHAGKNQLEAWEALGLQAIREGKVASVILSGGQGTRLGFDGPKGMYRIGLPSGKSIFQLMAERSIRVSELAGAKRPVPLYIMTSPLNDTVIREFWSSNGYFGMAASDVIFFAQGTLPCFGLDGKLLLETPGSLALAPDGNGGIYPALKHSGALADMERRGVEGLHVFSVDNVLVKVADPVFVGYCIATGADCGNKVVWKAHAAEKVGVVAQRNGKPCVVEYSEMDDATKGLTDPSTAKLTFGAGNICNHYFTLPFVRDTVLSNLQNLYHAARKKIPTLAFPSTTPVKPDRENGIKLETFICDVFPLSAKMALLEVDRADEFAPVKDAPGGAGDTPEKACAMLSDEAQRWVLAAGGTFLEPLTKQVDRLQAGKSEGGGKENGANVCEVSPLISYRGEGLEERVRGKALQLPFVLEQSEAGRAIK